MDVIDPGHVYTLRCLDDQGLEPALMLRFVKREGPGYPGNVGHHGGTTTQEVLRALIDRTKYVNNQIPSPYNKEVLHYLRSAIFELELRAAKRHRRTLNISDISKIEDEPYCEKCGHIGCKGDCH